MVASLRFLARSAIATSRFNACAPTTAATATLRSCFPINTCHAPHRHGLHASTSRPAASVEQASTGQTSPDLPSNSKTSPLDDPRWRHPRLGFAAADLPHLISIKLPRTATEDDMKALIARAGYPDAQITMYYFFETGKPLDFCYLKIADKNQVDATIAALSRFTLLGSELKPEKYDTWKLPPLHLPSLLAGWLPSPTSDLKSRVVRPPITTPPKLLSPLMAEQWILFLNLPPVDPAKKDARFEITREFYEKFHQYDVVGITTPREHHRKSNGWSCKILFGNRKDAKAALKSHVKTSFMGRVGRARTFRGGPDIHKSLWDYRRSLPEDTPDSEVGHLLEEKYKGLYKVQDADRQRRIQYPTPESAIGLKKDASTSD
ncbi:hypothetical protein BU25DRAFT_114175 [Macroventuria anomochaeta]|uniref:Uncharacterized protein n=1 Tax=Macroventuria anomochaeta TaxID=301207 RepID=A0ACB6RUS9_9PLEO|nr:uncharacterized protein BU25DRAFT_114175 [Macroventuria anomochaeta]KAF2625498.1 hypothetical protein BU25DRAFT_114175 [Macroventuria anomochaeta]